MTNTVNDQPLYASLQLTDYLLAWQGAQSPPTRKLTVSGLNAYYLPLTGGTLTGNTTLSSGNFAVSSGTTTLHGATSVTAGGLTVTGAVTASTAGTSGNQVVNFSQFAQTLGGTGHITLPGGFIFQWGSELSDPGTGVATVGFSPHFTTTCYGADATIVWTVGPLITSIFNLGVSTSSTQFQCSYLTGGAAAALGAQVFWWAWGK